MTAGRSGRPLVPVVATFAVGLMMALQSRINGELAASLGNGLQAAVISFGSGFVLLSVMAAAIRSVRGGLRRLPDAVRDGQLRWWQMLGGLLGGFFVAVQSATVPVIGVAVFTVAVVAGQSGSSILVDRAGLGPAGQRPVTPRRLTSAALAVVAVGVAVSDRLGAAGFSAAALAFALVAGTGIAVQQAINGRVGLAARSPVAAAWVNFAVGVAGLTGALGLAVGVAGQGLGDLPTGPANWWLYLGGAIGVAFIATAAWAVRTLGVLVFALLSIAGQLGGALLLDLLAPTTGAAPGFALVAGVALAMAAVVVAAAPRLARR